MVPPPHAVHAGDRMNIANGLLSVLALLLVPVSAAYSQPAATTTPVNSVTCESKPGARQACAADTSKGVVLIRSFGDAACLLGKTWGYEAAAVWVSDGCSA